jgi:hypothetical protein
VSCHDVLRYRQYSLSKKMKGLFLMCKPRAVVLVIAYLILSALPVSAATRSFSIAPYSVMASNQTFLSNGSVALGDGVTTPIYVNFTLPADISQDSTVKLRFYFTSLNLPCSMSFGSSYMGRMRQGLAKSESQPPGALIGLPKGGMSIVSFNQIESILIKSYDIRPPTSGSVIGQRAGDGIALVFRRAGNDSGDICPGDVELTNIEVRYTVP